MVTILAAIVVIGVIVLVHELGHFMAARSVGVRVDRFSIGFPPRFLTFTSIADGWEFRLFFYGRNSAGKLEWKPIIEKTFRSQGREGSGTEYCFALIPFGGYVKMAGMVDESMDSKIEHKPYELMSKPAWAQIWVMSAGVIMNMVLAIVLYTIVSWTTGAPIVSEDPVVAQTVEGKPAQEIGLQSGDRILEINGQTVTTWNEMAELIHAIPNSPIDLTWLHDGEEFEEWR